MGKRAYLVIGSIVAVGALLAVLGLPPLISFFQDTGSPDPNVIVLPETTWKTEKPSGTLVIKKWLSSSYEDEDLATETSVLVYLQSRSTIPPVLGREGLYVYAFVNTTRLAGFGDSTTFRFASSIGSAVHLLRSSLPDTRILNVVSPGIPPAEAYLEMSGTSFPADYGPLVAIFVFEESDSAPYQVDITIELAFTVSDVPKKVTFPYRIMLAKDASPSEPRGLPFPFRVDASLSDEDTIDEFHVEVGSLMDVEVELAPWRSVLYYLELRNSAGELVASAEVTLDGQHFIRRESLPPGSYRVLVIQAFGQGMYTLSFSRS